MIIKLLGKRVLIKQVEQEEVTKSGIVLPGTASKEKPITGEVLAVGNPTCCSTSTGCVQR